MGSSSPLSILPTLLCILAVLSPVLARAHSKGHAHNEGWLLSHRRNLKAIYEEENPQVLRDAFKKKTSTTVTTTATKKKQTEILKSQGTNSSTTNVTSLPNSKSTSLIDYKKVTPNLHPKSKTYKSTLVINTTTITTSPAKPSNSTKPDRSPKLSNLTTTTTESKKHSSFDSTTSSPKPRKKLLDPPYPKTTIITSSNTREQSNHLPKQVPFMERQDDSDSDDLITEFRGLPSKFHSAIVPDIRKISTTSRAYFTLANREFTRSFRPLVGNTYAPPLASLAFAALLLLHVALVTALFRHLRAHLPFQKLLLSVQIYFAVYFSILALTAAVTGLEPLRFFHAASPGTYEYTQVLQLLGYVMYLLLQLMNMAVAGPRALATAQLVMAMAVGLHYYTSVFHRAVLGQAPRINWRIHASYSVCFAVIYAFARAERRRKEYVRGGGGDGKES